MNPERGSQSEFEIRRFEKSDWPAVLPILRAAIAAGDTFTWDPDCSDAEINEAWIADAAATFVACAANGSVLGCYFIKPNQPGLGSHVYNAGYCVAPAARGRGIAASMCEHSQTQAIKLGARAMQYNIVISTNEPAVHLWQKLGFSIVGRLPLAYRHSQLGYVDAFVMYKQLVN